MIIPGTTSDRTREVLARAYLQIAEMAPFRGYIVRDSGVPALTKIANKVIRDESVELHKHQHKRDSPTSVFLINFIYSIIRLNTSVI